MRAQYSSVVQLEKELTEVDTAYEVELPPRVGMIRLQCRESSELRLSYVPLIGVGQVDSGAWDGGYWTLKADREYVEDNLIGARTIYLQSVDTPGITVEILAYV